MPKIRDPVQRAGRPNPSAIARWGGGTRVVSVECAGCGATHLQYRRSVEKARRLYCTVECYRTNRTGDRNPKWRGGLHDRTCAHCTKVFQVSPHQRDQLERRFCSPDCRVAGTRKYATIAEQRRVHGRRYECRQRAGRSDLPIHTEAEWKALLARHGGRCVHCGTTERIERDHIVPLSKGGDDSISNVQPLCVTCNRRKWNKT